MTGSMYAAISGMRAHMDKLSVIGNNVSNVNTYGYKSTRASFKESLYTTVRTGSNGTDLVGGTNPSQLGYGCTIGTIDLDMSTKNYVPTGRNLDCMISGDGFFMVGGKPSIAADGSMDVTEPQNLSLTRVGAFKVDSQGYLTDNYGQIVYGFVTCSTGDQPGVCDTNDPGVSTQLVPIRLPLAAQEGNGDGVKAGTAIYPGVNGDGINVYDRGGGDDALTDGSKTIQTNVTSIAIDGETGKITCVNDADNAIVVVGYIPLAKVGNPNGVTHVEGPYYRAMEGAGDCTAASIGGVLDGRYFNNQQEGEEGSVPIFAAGKTTLIPNGLESSGTDVATEFSEMITTQRGYQANTRIITVTDSMLEELVNIKR